MRDPPLLKWVVTWSYTPHVSRFSQVTWPTVPSDSRGTSSSCIVSTRLFLFVQTVIHLSRKVHLQLTYFVRVSLLCRATHSNRIKLVFHTPPTSLFQIPPHIPDPPHLRTPTLLRTSPSPSLHRSGLTTEVWWKLSWSSEKSESGTGI